EEGGADQGPGRAPRGGAQGGADARAVALSLEARIRRLPGGKRRQRWAAVGRHRTRSQRIVSRLPGTIRRMNTPSSVVGCSSCGALHTPTPGDRGLCAACRRLLVSDVPWRGDTAGAGTAPKKPQQEKASRPRPIRNGASRRIVIGAVVAFIVAGLGAGVAMRRQPLSDSWTKIERHMKSGVFSTIRRRTSAIWATMRRQSSDAWVAVRRQSSDAWVAVQRRLPFDASEGKGSDSIAPA